MFALCDGLFDHALRNASGVPMLAGIACAKFSPPILKFTPFALSRLNTLFLPVYSGKNNFYPLNPGFLA